MSTDKSVRWQASVFALMVVARPVTNRELKELAGVEIDAETRRLANTKVERIATKKRGAVNTHKLTPEGQTWCASALTLGRPDGSKFPAGVLYALLGGVGQYLGQSGIKLDEFFQPDMEGWVRAVYTELTVRRGPGSWVKLSRLRPWFEDVPRDVLDATLDRMVEQSDVELMAELIQGSLSAEDRDAAVDIGGEDRHQLKIESA